MRESRQPRQVKVLFLLGCIFGSHQPPLGFVRGVTTKKSHFFRPMDSQSVAEYSPIACLTLLSLRLPSCFLYFRQRSARFTLSLFLIHSSEERTCMSLMPRTPHADASSSFPLPSPPHLVCMCAWVCTAHACVPKCSCDMFLLAQLPVRAPVKAGVWYWVSSSVIESWSPVYHGAWGWQFEPASLVWKAPGPSYPLTLQQWITSLRYHSRCWEEAQILMLLQQSRHPWSHLLLRSHFSTPLSSVRTCSTTVTQKDRFAVKPRPACGP